MKHNVQTFRAASMPAALELVRRELGTDAVILGTRSMPGGRIGRLMRREQVEITAASADTPARGPRLAVRPARKAEAKQPPEAPSVPERVHPYFVQLVQNEVAEELAARILRAAARAMPPGLVNDDEAVRDVLCRCIARLIPTVPVAAPAGGTVRRIALVGPPGGGKTTTTAKLAAHFKLRLHKRVALLSLDGRRVAGEEQLRRFADLIQVPVGWAGSASGVRDALARMRDVDYVLIDTGGVGLREEQRLDELGELMKAADPDEVHLVLPACLANEVQVRISQVFKKLDVTGVVITHVDEAVGLGVILNVVNLIRCKLSYLSGGQDIATDLEEACSSRLAALIIGKTVNNKLTNFDILND